MANIVVYKQTTLGVARLDGWGPQEFDLFAMEAWERMTEGGVQVGERNADYCFPPSWEWLRPEPNWLQLPSPIYRFRYL